MIATAADLWNPLFRSSPPRAVRTPDVENVNGSPVARPHDERPSVPQERLDHRCRSADTSRDRTTQAPSEGHALHEAIVQAGDCSMTDDLAHPAWLERESSQGNHRSRRSAGLDAQRAAAGQSFSPSQHAEQLRHPEAERPFAERGDQHLIVRRGLLERMVGSTPRSTPGETGCSGTRSAKNSTSTASTDSSRARRSTTRLAAARRPSSCNTTVSGRSADAWPGVSDTAVVLEIVVEIEAVGVVVITP